MLSCSLGSLSHCFPFAPPGRVGGRKGFCSRAIPGPGLSQNPALCGSPPTKCSSALALYGARVVSRWGGRCCASILPPPRTPALDKEAPAEPCPHCRRSRAGSFRRQRPGSRQSRQPRLCRLHSAVRLRRVYLYLPAIPPHLRRGEPRRKCSGRAGGSRSQLFNCFRLLAQRMSGSAFGGLWPPRLIALSAHNHAFASARHPLRRWVPFSLGFAHGRYPFDSALSRARWARTPESVCAHILPVFAGGREPGVSRPLYRQSPSFLTR